ncbi:hypothetical protein [Streptomyces turgidiscabies]|uniref:SMI1/KNR4 family protein n=1 Tax=Streptomyces turgidiscabies TaxID=85558 RepID=A0ABU0RHB0_9ACTN|nr:hypothetical protein [Streptomyces turgidiscabies]MDQ0931372.1 hypothetical protein [Streptomyces turgidiscabies]
MKPTAESVRFLNEEVRAPRGLREVPSIDFPSETGALIELLSQEWEGCVLPCYGGNYYGWTRISVSPGGWTSSPEGDEFIRIAENHDAPCAIVLRRDGRVGVSWSGEYTDMFADFTEFVETVALWSTLRGWTGLESYGLRYFDAVEFVSRGRTSPVTGGSLTRWTRFDDAVVLEEPFLTGDPDRPPRVHVVVADPALLAGSDFVKSLPYPMFSTLGQGFPELPARWV